MKLENTAHPLQTPMLTSFFPGEEPLKFRNAVIISVNSVQNPNYWTSCSDQLQVGLHVEGQPVHPQRLHNFWILGFIKCFCGFIGCTGPTALVATFATFSWGGTGMQRKFHLTCILPLQASQNRRLLRIVISQSSNITADAQLDGL